MDLDHHQRRPPELPVPDVERGGHDPAHGGAAREAGSRLVGAGLVGSFEIVLVDDASTDGTGKIADELADDDPRIVVVHHPENRKLGAQVGLRRRHRRRGAVHRRGPALRAGRG